MNCFIYLCLEGPPKPPSPFDNVATATRSGLRKREDYAVSTARFSFKFRARFEVNKSD